MNTLTNRLHVGCYLEALGFTLTADSGLGDYKFEKGNYLLMILEEGNIKLFLDGLYGTLLGETFGELNNTGHILDEYKNNFIELLKFQIRKVKLELLDTNETIESRYKIKHENFMDEILSTVPFLADVPKIQVGNLTYYFGPSGKIYSDLTNSYFMDEDDDFF